MLGLGGLAVEERLVAAGEVDEHLADALAQELGLLGGDLGAEHDVAQHALGFGARMVVTGDTSQVDLPRGTQSGLAQAVEVLEGIEGLEMVRFDSSDVVRHSLVSAIVDAYDAARGPAERSQKRGGARRGR